MPVTKGTYGDIESLAYSYITKELGYNTAIACGILANINNESSFNPKAENKNGAYGLIQWLGDRKKRLIAYTTTTKPTALQQLQFMKYELNNTETKARDAIKNLSNTDIGAYEAGRIFGYRYERFSKDPYSAEGIERAREARDKFWPYYSKNGSVDSSRFVPNLGQKIVQIARSTVGLDYIRGGEMYDTNNKGADCSGLVYYCYKEAGVSIARGTADSYYQKYKSSAKQVDPSNVSAADLLFYENNSSKSGVDHVAIANGSGGRIHASSPERGIVEDKGLGNPIAILRILSDTETSQGDVSGVIVEGLDPSAYESLTSYDPYADLITRNLSRVSAVGYDYGYLIDMTNGGEFKFYIPEFSEQAGAQWDTIDIRGRSVDVKAYKSTSSRTITISLDLYAGVGVYKATSNESGEDTVDRLHRDAYFLKSLEYPDYSNVITRPPAVVHLILGSALNIVGVVSNVVVEHLKPLDQYNRAMYLKVSFTVTQIATNPVDYRDVRNGQYTMISTNNIDSLLIGDDSEPTNAPVYTGR